MPKIEYAKIIRGNKIYSIPGLFLPPTKLERIGHLLEGQRGVVVDKHQINYSINSGIEFEILELLMSFNVSPYLTPRYRVCFRTEGLQILTNTELVQDLTDFELRNLMKAIKDLK